MLVVGSVLIAGAAAAAAAYFAARRWPGPVAAPRVDPATVVEEVQAHPGFARFVKERTNAAELTGLALTTAVGLCVLGAIGIGLLLAMIRTDSGFARWDTVFAQFGADHATSTSTAFLRDVSLLGGTPGVILVSLIVAAVEVRRTRSAAVVGFLVLAVGGQFAASNLIKLIVDRDRPAIRHLTGFSGSSFPSGHSTAAAATFMACALLLGRRRSERQRALLVSGAAGIAGAVAASRVLLGVHWFTDVLAGLLLGWAWFALSSIAFGGRILRFGTTAEQTEAVAEVVAPAGDPDQPKRQPEPA